MQTTGSSVSISRGSSSDNLRRGGLMAGLKSPVAQPFRIGKTSAGSSINSPHSGFVSFVSFVVAEASNVDLFHRPFKAACEWTKILNRCLRSACAGQDRRDGRRRPEWQGSGLTSLCPFCPSSLSCPSCPSRPSCPSYVVTAASTPRMYAIDSIIPGRGFLALISYSRPTWPW
jgi:hypothetical protein